MNILIKKISKAFILVIIFYSQQLFAEPYMAIKTGAKCGSCHINQTGGGKRTHFGNITGQISMASLYKIKDSSGQRIDSESPENLWTGEINEYLSIGGDMRSSAIATETQNGEDTFEFSMDEALLYIQIDAIPNRLILYLDEQLAPGTAYNREAFALLWNSSNTLYLKAGKMFLPYGYRVEDDNSFMRQVSGINYTVSDEGVEAGLDMGPWSANLAITNGTAGGSETNQDKQISFRGVYIKPDWRAGLSYNFNKSDNDADRTMQNIFIGFRYGITSWLFEFDRITDDDPTSGKLEQEIAFLETNIEFLKGHNIKLTLEGLDPDLAVDNNYRTRNSLVWEFVPIQFTQLRLGYRKLEGIPQSDVQNSEELFFQLHNYF